MYFAPHAIVIMFLGLDLGLCFDSGGFFGFFCSELSVNADSGSQYEEIIVRACVREVR